MKPKHKKTVIAILTLIAIMYLPMLATAQIDGLPSEPDAPIDGGLSLLVVAGAGYGVRKLKAKRLANKNNSIKI